MKKGRVLMMTYHAFLILLISIQIGAMLIGCVTSKTPRTAVDKPDKLIKNSASQQMQKDVQASDDAQREATPASVPIEVVKSSELNRKYDVVAVIEAVALCSTETPQGLLEDFKDMARTWYHGDALLDLTKTPSPVAKDECIWSAKVIVWTP